MLIFLVLLAGRPMSEVPAMLRAGLIQKELSLDLEEK